MYDNARRIDASLVRIAQADAATAHDRRRVLCDGGFEFAGQVAGRHVEYGSTKRPLDRGQHVADRRAMQRRNRDALGEIEERQPPVEFVAHVFPVRRAESIPLVDHDDERAAVEAFESSGYFYAIHLENQGGVVMPVPLRLVYTDGTEEEVLLPAARTPRLLVVMPPGTTWAGKVSITATSNASLGPALVTVRV